MHSTNARTCVQDLGFYEPSQELDENVTPVIIEDVYHGTAFLEEKQKLLKHRKDMVEKFRENLVTNFSLGPSIMYSLL